MPVFYLVLAQLTLLAMIIANWLGGSVVWMAVTLFFLGFFLGAAIAVILERIR